MKTRTFNLELLSPLALSGAEAGQPDDWGLRPPSIKGVMRYWFRALAGGVLGADRAILRRLREWEDAIFGSTSQGSSFRLQLKGWQGTQFDFPGRDYATFPFNPQMRDYKPVTGFRQGEATLEISYQPAIVERKRLSVDDLDYLVCASLYMAVVFGGLGSRSRRGVGSFSFTANDSNLSEKGLVNPAALSANDLNGLLSRLSQSLQQVRQKFAELINDGNLTNISDLPLFHVLHPDYCKIFIGQTMPADPRRLVNVYENARKHYFWDGKLRQARQNRRIIRLLQPDNERLYQLAAGLSPTGTSLPVLNKPALGLPLNYTFKAKLDHPPRGAIAAGREDVTLQLTALYNLPGNQTKEINRRGSPVFLSFLRCGSQVHGCAVIFYSSFAGDHDQVAICCDGQPVGEAPYAHDRSALEAILDPLCRHFRDTGWREISF